METSIEFCSLGVALATIAVFSVVRKFDFGGWFHAKIVRPVSEASYGMYLMHMFILTPVFAALGPRVSTPVAILATAAATYVLCAGVAALVRKVPHVGKWIC
jgi:peptidoglycan/LPS O-acetylase OafA/YrhL